ncbi:uncharacterized protein LOC123273222 [Cotesia glomerata]|uniref:uncharacterized protein LOC123273222 n=1 Tax=Cotesia glomerata TaxID=32391 RepID=UPI001D01832D|nr:uncharacterized protein LOC123273222 [Cotesia glomerata]
MCEIKNKVPILIFNFIVIVVTNLDAIKITLIELSVGDTLNIHDLSFNSVEKIGDLFKGYNRNKFIKNVSYPDNSFAFEILKQPCLSLESLQLYSYQQIWVKKGKKSTSLPFSYFDTNSLGIPEYYLNNRYIYGIVQICRAIKSSELNIRVIDKADLPNIKQGVYNKVLSNSTAVFRLKQYNETHYVSLITTGNCIYQVYVNHHKFCNTNSNFNPQKIDNFFESSVYQSFIMSANNNQSIDNWINDYYTQSDLYYSLHSFSNFSKQTQLEIFNHLGNDVVINLELQPLLKLPRTKNKIRRTNRHKSLNQLQIGDIIDTKDLEKTDSHLNVDHKLYELLQHYSTIPFINYNFTDCINYKNSEKIDFKLMNNMDSLDGHSTSKFYERINVFEEIAKRKHYGVKREYLNEAYKCIKTTICSEFEVWKLDTAFSNIINLNGKMINYKNYIFDRENIILTYGRDKTHYVIRTESGNCLFQAVIFPAASNNADFSNPLYAGRIISASNDSVLENWVENYLDNRKRNLFNIKQDILAQMTIVEKLKNINFVLINIYLDRIL